MADRLDRELGEILKPLDVEMELSNTSSVAGDIMVACFYHIADNRDWGRLQQHLEVVQWQFRQQSQREMTLNIFEYDPKDVVCEMLLAKVINAIDQAHIVLLGLSVDMQLVLQQHLKIYSTVLLKLEQVKQVRGSYQSVPQYVAGIRIKEILWDEEQFSSMEMLPPYQQTLAAQQRKDTICVAIARQVLEWAENIAAFQRSAGEEREDDG